MILIDIFKYKIMKKKLPNPYEFFMAAMLKTSARLNNEIPEQNMIEAFKEYGKQVRDYTLEIAAENASLQIEETQSSIRYKSHTTLDSSKDKEQTWIVAKDSILNLKNSKELEI